jgi:hypothetical protein
MPYQFGRSFGRSDTLHLSNDPFARTRANAHGGGALCTIGGNQGHNLRLNQHAIFAIVKV